MPSNSTIKAASRTHRSSIYSSITALQNGIYHLKVVDDPLHLGLTSRETPEERRLRKRVFLKDDIKW